MKLDGFKPEEIDTPSYEPLPEGWYVAMIIESEEKKTKAGTGSYLALTFEIDDGPAKGRKIWANLNLDNPNAKAVEIATRDLASICKAVSVMVPKDSEDLHYKRLAIRIKIKEGRNEIGGYRALKAEGASAPANPGKASAPANTPAAPKTPPWQRKAS